MQKSKGQAEELQKLLTEERAGAGEPIIEARTGALYVEGPILGLTFYDEEKKGWRYILMYAREVTIPPIGTGWGRDHEAVCAQLKGLMRLWLKHHK